MKKKLIALLGTFVFCISPMTVFAEQAPTSEIELLEEFEIFEEPIILEIEHAQFYYGYGNPQNPFTSNQEIYVPIRLVTEQFGGEISWDSTNKSLTATIDACSLEIDMNDFTVLIDGVPQVMASKPILDRDFVYIPVSWIGEVFQKEVVWLNYDHAIAVYTAYDKALETEVFIHALNANHYVRGLRFSMTDPYMHITRNSYLSDEENEWLETWPTESAIRELRETWGITEKAHVSPVITLLSTKGLNAEYQTYLASIDENKLYPVAERKKISTALEIQQKFGENGLIGYDLYCMANIARLSYMAGYISFEEYIQLALPVAQEAQQKFASWEAFDENYTYGLVFDIGENLKFPNDEAAVSEIENYHKAVVSRIPMLPDWNTNLTQDEQKKP